MINAATSRVRLHDLARLRRSGPDTAGGAGLHRACAWPASAAHRCSRHRQASATSPQTHQLLAHRSRRSHGINHHLAYLHPMTSLPFRPSFRATRARARNRLARRMRTGRSPASTRACRRTGCRSGCRTEHGSCDALGAAGADRVAAGLIDMAVLEGRPARDGNCLVPAPARRGDRVRELRTGRFSAS